MLKSINPATGQVIAEHAETSPAEAHAVLERAGEAQLRWREVELAERCGLLSEVAVVLRHRAEACARLMAREMGKPLAQGRSEMEKCAWVCEHYARTAPAMLAPEPIATDAANSFVVYRPLGVVLAIMPWNFPFWQAVRCAAPALAAGNAVVIKSAPNVPSCAMALAEVFETAGCPSGLIGNLLVAEENVAALVAGLIAQPSVAAVSLTGSLRAGRTVAAAAGAALKKAVLELGGSDASVILSDADVEMAVASSVASRLINNGQSCIAAKRLIVPAALRADVEARAVALMAAAVVGDPLDPATDIGPLARADLRASLQRQVTASVAAGARLLLGGEVPAGPGWYYPPTVLGGVVPGMPAYEEELFGPVLAVLEARDDADALRIANDTAYGLGAAVYTRDVARGQDLASRMLQAGNCFVNTFVRSDPRLPFGGVKASGYGRELGRHGLLEFTNVKTVYVA